MDHKKLDKIISIIKEMMVANAPGSQGGGGSQTNPTGKNGLVGFDPLIGKRKKDGGVDFRRVAPSYKKWVKSLDNK